MNQVASLIAIQQAEQIQRLLRSLDNATEDLRRMERERDSTRDLNEQLRAKIKALSKGAVSVEPLEKPEYDG